MKTPAQYQHELNEMLSGGTPTTEQLRELEQLVQRDLFALEMQFKGREASELNRTSKQSGKERADQQKHLLEEKNRKLAPYQDLLKKISEIIGD